MTETIKKQFRLQVDVLGVGLLLTVGGWIAGGILYWIIARFIDGKDVYIPLGTIIGIIMSLFYYFVSMISGMQTNFQIEIAMGCTRKRFFVSYYLINLVYALLTAGALLLLHEVENAIGSRMYAETEKELVLFGYLLRYAVPVIALIISVGSLCAALIMRYGKKAGWTLYAVWMVVMILGPRISDAVTEAPDSLFGHIGRAVQSVAQAVPFSGWVLLGILIVVGSIGGAYALIRRQQVA